MRSPSRRSFRRMNLRLIVAVSAVALAALACGPQESSTDAAGTWVGTITTEGDVTTVVNESGSVWGGVATLVEEVSIGLETGDVPYLFGRVGDSASDDARWSARVPQATSDRPGSLHHPCAFSSERPGESRGES